MKDIVKAYIDSKGWQYKIVPSQNGEQFQCHRCPFCHDTAGTHFYISAKSGQYYCHHCQAAGSFYTLKKHLGDLTDPISFKNLVPEETLVIDDKEYDEIQKSHLRLLQDKDALLYLSSRRLGLEAVRHFKLGLTEEDNITWLSFPYMSHGKLKNIKYRTLPPAQKKFRRALGGESSLYNDEVLQEKLDKILIVEGEMDLLSLWSKGFKNVVATSIGAGGIKNEWIEQLDKVPIIFICYDNDDAGQIGAQKLAARLGLEKCKQIRLPNGYKDINEYFQKGHTAIHFQKLIDVAVNFDVENVISLGGLIQETIRHLTAGVPEERYILPWKSVNKLVNGFVPGDLIVIAGKPGTGKSSLSFNILYHWAMIDIPVLLFSLEMPPWRILPRIVALHKRKDSLLCNDAEILSEAYKELRNVPFYLAYKYTKLDWNFVADTIRHSVRRYGIKFVVFDNLHFLCRSLAHQTEEVSITIQNFKLLAQELAIPIVVIARPRKTTAKIITGEDIKNSADVEGDADVILIIARDRKKSMSGEDVEGNFEPQTLIVADKVRYSAGGSVHLMADDAQCRFYEM